MLVQNFAHFEETDIDDSVVPVEEGVEHFQLTDSFG